MANDNYETISRSIQKQFEDASNALGKWASLSSILMKGISQLEKALSELKTTDSLLTEISKANASLSETDLLDIAGSAFTVGSRYGIKANDYLSDVLKMMQAGYQNAEALAELSSAVRSAGNMTSALADQYIIAADKAYGLNGNIEKMTEFLDGSSNIASNHTIQISELAEAMTILGNRAAESGVSAKEAAAALAAVSEASELNSSETAEAFGNILSNLRQISDTDNGITSEGLEQYEQACNALNVSLTETKNGVASLRSPMAVLEDLAGQYHALGSDNAGIKNLLSASGGLNEAAALEALLSRWDTYKTMLREYENGSGSLAETAAKTADSWEGSLTRLSNTWNDTIAGIADSDAVITGINGLNRLLEIVNDVTKKLDSWGTLGAGLGAFLSSKNLGRVKC